MMQNRKNSFVFFVACFVSLGGILYGYDMGVISGALLFMQKDIPLTEMQTGCIVGAVLGGGLIGTLLSGPIGDLLGRRLLILLSGVVFLLGISFILLATDFYGLLAARLFLGVGVGVVAVAVPLYVAEMVPDQDRGRYVTFFQLLLTIGILLAYCVDLFFSDTGNWRAMFAVLIVPSLILFVGSFFLPETPRWLLANARIEQARHVLSKILPDEKMAARELWRITEGLQAEETSSWREIFSSKFLLPSLVAVAIAIFNQLTGINSFLQYAPLILKNAGLSSDMVSMAGSAGIGALNFLFTLLAITLVDGVGRRPLLLIGIVGVVISEIFLGAVDLYSQTLPNAGILSLLGLFLFIVSFAIGPGVVVWLAISELFPTRVRGKGVAICLFFNSLAATLLATYFLPIVKYFSMGVTYWLFAFFSLLYFVVVYFFLPETKKKSLEEIQFSFQER
ncbi:MAG: sugar porter family MFS transporter [Gammaproteobacteria bacterium]|nr:sugar porter family MFS transporter [Gammaproteobacteria bacterium]